MHAGMAYNEAERQTMGMGSLRRLSPADGAIRRFLWRTALSLPMAPWAPTPPHTRAWQAIEAYITQSSLANLSGTTRNKTCVSFPTFTHF